MVSWVRCSCFKWTLLNKEVLHKLYNLNGVPLVCILLTQWLSWVKLACCLLSLTSTLFSVSKLAWPKGCKTSSAAHLQERDRRIDGRYFLNFTVWTTGVCWHLHAAQRLCSWLYRWNSFCLIWWWKVQNGESRRWQALSLCLLFSGFPVIPVESIGCVLSS